MLTKILVNNKWVPAALAQSKDPNIQFVVPIVDIFTGKYKEYLYV